MPILTTEGIKIHFREAGAGRTVLVLLHGNFASWRWWQPLFERLPSGIHAFAPVTRGCGYTMASATNCDVAQLSRDLLHFTEALGLERFHLVGHSLGGAIATQFALDHQRKVKSLTLVSPAPPGGLQQMQEGDSLAARTLSLLDPSRGGSLMKIWDMIYRWGSLCHTKRFMLRQALIAMMPTARLDAVSLDQLVDDAARLSPETIRGFYEALHRWDVAARLPELRVPTQILVGGRDALIPRGPLAEATRALPRARLICWERVGHSAMLERPQAFADLLFRFIGARSFALRLRWWADRLLARIGRVGPRVRAALTRGRSVHARDP